MKQLKNQLQCFGLTKTGNKKVLVDRLAILKFEKHQQGTTSRTKVDSQSSFDSQSEVEHCATDPLEERFRHIQLEIDVLKKKMSCQNCESKVPLVQIQVKTLFSRWLVLLRIVECQFQSQQVMMEIL